MSADILSFPGNPGAPVQPLTVPRRHFGLREPIMGDLPSSVTRALDIACGRPDDRSAQDRIKKLARDARNALDGGHVCPSLLKAKAGHAEGLAQALRALGAECKALGALKQANTFCDAADLVELAGAELEAPHTEPA